MEKMTDRGEARDGVGEAASVGLDELFGSLVRTAPPRLDGNASVAPLPPEQQQQQEIHSFFEQSRQAQQTPMSEPRAQHARADTLCNALRPIRLSRFLPFLERQCRRWSLATVGLSTCLLQQQASRALSLQSRRQRAALTWRRYWPR